MKFYLQLSSSSLHKGIMKSMKICDVRLFFFVGRFDFSVVCCSQWIRVERSIIIVDCLANMWLLLRMTRIKSTAIVHVQCKNVDNIRETTRPTSCATVTDNTEWRARRRAQLTLTIHDAVDATRNQYNSTNGTYVLQEHDNFLWFWDRARW